MRLYTTKEKMVHAEQAEVYVKEGKGTYSSYAREAGIPRTTLHKWIHDVFSSRESKNSRMSEHGIIKLGKPMVHSTSTGRFSVDYYGATIEVRTSHDLVELLKSIKKASTT